MRISEAKKAYSAQAGALWDRRQTLSKLLKEQTEGASLPSFDRVELSRQLAQTDREYERTRGILESITARETMIRDTENAKQQSEAQAKAAEEMLKMMEVFRRIASGGKVPPEDERKLMEYDAKLYMAAKAAALLAKEEKEYDSLWQEEEEEGEKKSADEIAADADVQVARPEAPAPVEAAAE